MQTILTSKQTTFISANINKVSSEAIIPLKVLDEDLDYHPFRRDPNRNAFQYSLWDLLELPERVKKKILAEMHLFVSNKNTKYSFAVLTAIDEYGTLFEIEYYTKEPKEKINAYRT